MKYYLTFLNGTEKEVTKEEYIRSEQSAGFRSKFGPDEIATSSFSNRTISGRVDYKKE
jgi:hypothetical protein